MLREDFIHYVLRLHLKDKGWELLAGQYPNGSDDELRALNVIDPAVARDQSPDPRRHSMNKLVPDLVARRANHLLVVEIKPGYSAEDEMKLDLMLNERLQHFHAALEAFTRARVGVGLHVGDLTLVPALAFSSDSPFIRRNDFIYFLVDENAAVTYLGSEELPSIG